MNFLSELEILQICSDNPSPSCIRAVEFAGQLAAKCGASVRVAPAFPSNPNSFGGRGKRRWQPDPQQTALDWAASKPNRVLLVANTDQGIDKVLAGQDVSAVEVFMERWQSEPTLCAQTAFADMLGDPEREPLVPAAHYAAGSAGYAAFCALTAVFNKIIRLGKNEVACVNGMSALAWINWKAAAAGARGDDISREGKAAEWPVIPCKDGFTAFVFNGIRDWKAVVKLIDDDRLRDEKYDSFEDRKKYRDEYMAVVREWALTKTKSELNALYVEYQVPAAAVSSPADLLQDPLLLHRNAFETVSGGNGQQVKTPLAPHRIVNKLASDSPATPKAPDEHISPAGPELPLSGIRVLDLGIITAGAGAGGLLADMGAEVLKIESGTYPDPFRFWAGSLDSPLFKFNNRNKFGLDIDLKTDRGKQQFLELVKSADIITENFRRGVLDRMGFTFEKLREVNPKIVLASISGQGVDGPGSHHTTFGSTLEASSGFAWLTCYQDGKPCITGRNVNYPDQTVALYAAAIIALAAGYSERHNCALQVDISQRDVAVFIIGDVLERVSGGAADDVNAIRESGKDNDVEGIYTCADGHYVALSIPSIEQLNASSELAQIDSEATLASWIQQQDADQVVAVLLAAGCGAARALKGSEMYKLPRIVAEGVFAKTATGNMVKGFPFRLLGSEMKIWGDAPTVGEHTDQFVAA